VSIQVKQMTEIEDEQLTGQCVDHYQHSVFLALIFSVRVYSRKF